MVNGEIRRRGAVVAAGHDSFDEATCLRHAEERSEYPKRPKAENCLFF